MRKIIYISTGFLLLFPLLVLAYLSVVTNWSFPQLINGHFTLTYWLATFSSSNELLSGFVTSFFIAISIASLATALGFVVSLYIMFHKYQQKLVPLAFYTYLISPVVFGAMLNYYFIRMDLTGTLTGVLFAQWLYIFPYSILLFSTFWNERVKQLAFQSFTLGASKTQSFIKILIPLAKPWLLLCFIQCFLISWFEYGITKVIGLGKISTLTTETMKFINEANPHLAAVSAGLMIFPLLLIFVMAQFVVTKKITPTI